MPCSTVDLCRRFEEVCCLLLQVRRLSCSVGIFIILSSRWRQQTPPKRRHIYKNIRRHIAYDSNFRTLFSCPVSHTGLLHCCQHYHTVDSENLIPLPGPYHTNTKAQPCTSLSFMLVVQPDLSRSLQNKSIPCQQNKDDLSLVGCKNCSLSIPVFLNLCETAAR
jgi:hypothetical protein